MKNYFNSMRCISKQRKEMSVANGQEDLILKPSLNMMLGKS